MTARRQARGAGTPATGVVNIAGVALRPPVELMDPDHPLWADRVAYERWLAERGWQVTAGDRLGGSTHPHNRRNNAAEQWAIENAVALSSDQQADWNQLRRAGLIA